MGIKFLSKSAAVKKYSLPKYGAIQKHFATTLFLIVLLGCVMNGSNNDSNKTEIHEKDLGPKKNLESENQTISNHRIPLLTDVDSIEHEHGYRIAIKEVVVQKWPLRALLNYGDADIFHEIRDKHGNFPTNPSERLYAANHYQPPLSLLTPIKAPNGHHVTLSEWQTAQGTLMVHCNGLTSTVEIGLEGMIPNGTYTT
ncbi:MAG: hypothetical protein WBM83_11410, partial [Flavobacteriaceae bacterium]